MNKTRIIGLVIVMALITITALTNEYSNTGSSGSYGGGGVITTECINNIQLKETRENDLRVNAYVPFYFTSDTPIYQIDVKGFKNDADVAIRVELLNDISCRLTVNPPGRIYKFVNIFSGIKQDGVKIAFKVESKWITTGITLMRWQDGAWNDLNAIQTGADDKYTYFEANAPGFSQFAIVESATPEPTLISTPALTPAKPDVSIVSVTASQEPETGLPYYGVILAILLTLIVVMFVIWYFKIRKENQ